MSDVMTDDQDSDTEQSPPLTDQQIIDYLQANPGFLKKNPEACEFLLPPDTASGKGVADFQSFMIKRLKDDKEKISRTTQEIVETSRANMNNQQRVHRAVLRLLECDSFDDFIRSITIDLASILNVDIATLVVEANGHEIPHIHTSGIRVIPPGTVQGWMKEQNILLQDNIAGIEPIYGSGATLVQSQILLRVDIAMDTPPAIVAFGSRDPDMFQEGQATDQILFLARVIERCFRMWLRLPQ